MEASKSETCELVRIGDGVLSSETFPSISEESKCFDQNRQYNSYALHQQTRGYKVSPFMSWDSWNLVLKNNIQIKAANIIGKQNYLADFLSHKEIRSGEWVLKSSVVNSLFALWGQPIIDLFATQENKKAMLFCSWIPF